MEDRNRPPNDLRDPGEKVEHLEDELLKIRDALAVILDDKVEIWQLKHPPLEDFRKKGWFHVGGYRGGFSRHRRSTVKDAKNVIGPILYRIKAYFAGDW